MCLPYSIAWRVRGYSAEKQLAWMLCVWLQRIQSILVLTDQFQGMLVDPLCPRRLSDRIVCITTAELILII